MMTPVRILALFVFSLMALKPGSTQDIILNTQSQVDAFPQGVAVVEGSLTIKSIGTDRITDLSPLSELDSVKGTVRIEDNDMLEDLSPLDGLEHIGMSLFLKDNDRLESINAFSQIKELGGSLSVSGNYSLTDVGGLSQLQKIHGTTWIESNDNLPQIDGLSGLDSIGGELSIVKNKQLGNIDGLQRLEHLGTRLYVSQNDALTDMSGLSALRYFNGWVDFQHNHSLRSLAGLEGITELESFYMTDHPALESLDGLDNLQSIQTRGLDIRDATSLRDISALGNLQSVVGEVIFINCPQLESLNGLDSLQWIGGGTFYGLRLAGTGLKNLEGLGRLKEIRGYCWIVGNDQLESLEGLSSLREINGYLSIERNDNLRSVDGLDSLKTVDGFLSLYQNPSLQHLDGFSQLSSIGENPPDGQSTITDLRIVNNRSLGNCCGIRHLLEATTPHISTEILGNPSPCSSRDDIKAFTICGGDTAVQPGAIRVAPNPFTSQVLFNGLPEGAEIILTDAMAREVRRIPYSSPAVTLERGSLSPGLYFYLITIHGKRLKAGRLRAD